MEDRGSAGAMGALSVLAAAAVVLGVLLLHNWLAHKLVTQALAQPPMAFPTIDFHSPLVLTPWAETTPLSLIGLYDPATPTPFGNVYIVNR